MTAPRPLRPRPLVTAAARQAPVVAGGAALSGGLPGLYLALAPQPFGRLDVLAVVALAAAPQIVSAVLALARVVWRAEPQVTPRGDERNDAGQQLIPPDEALKALLRRNLAAQGGGDQRPRRQGPSGTQVSRAGTSARSMTVDDAGSYPAASGQAWEPEVDWVADQARADDERRARQQPVIRPSGHRMRRQQS